MFVPKSKMHIIIHALDVAIQYGGLTAEEKEVMYQISDQAALCANGDANFLEVGVCYADKPK